MSVQIAYVICQEGHGVKHGTGYGFIEKDGFRAGHAKSCLILEQVAPGMAAHAIQDKDLHDLEADLDFMAHEKAMYSCGGS